MGCLAYLVCAGGLGTLGFFISPPLGLLGLALGGFVAWQINHDRRVSGLIDSTSDLALYDACGSGGGDWSDGVTDGGDGGGCDGGGGSD